MFGKPTPYRYSHCEGALRPEGIAAPCDNTATGRLRALLFNAGLSASFSILATCSAYTSWRSGFVAYGASDHGWSLVPRNTLE